MGSSLQNLLRHHSFRLTLTIALFLSAACNSTSPTGVPTEAIQPTLSGTKAAPTPIPSPTPTVVAGTVSIWHAWDEAELPALTIIIKAFQQEYPDVYFDVTYFSAQDLLAHYKAETLSGKGPDVLLGPAIWGDDLDQSNLLVDLSDYAEERLLSTINRAALQASQKDEKTISLPYSLEGVVLYRNKDVSTLDADSMQELASLAQTTTQGEVIGAYLEQSFFFSGAHLEGLGGHLMDEEGLPAFNTPAGLAWVELLQSFSSAGLTSFQSDEDLQAFKEGKVGWIIDGTWNLPGLIDALGPEKLAIDPWPTYGPGRMSGYVQSENAYLNININETQKLAAWKFIEFLVSPAAQAHLGDIGRIPSGSGVNLTNPVSGALITQAMTALANGVPYPHTPYLSIYEVQLNIALQSIFEGSSPGAALQIAQSTIQEEILSLEVTATPTP